jgi:hypothetical protein
MPIHDWKRVNSGLFHHFHHQWVSRLCDALNGGALPEGFYALAEQNAKGPIPDVLTLNVGDSRGQVDRGLALATAPPQTRFTLRADLDAYVRRANRIAIHHPIGDVVCVIEIVSPGNKSSAHALKTFVEKSVAFINRGIHLLVIDLFPPSKRDPQGIHKAIWDEFVDEPFELPADKPLTLVAYSAGDTPTAYIEPAAVGDRLADMPLFLESEAYVQAPLEATYESTWSSLPKPLKKMLEG